MNYANNINQEITEQSHCPSHSQNIKGTYVANRSCTFYRTSNGNVDKIWKEIKKKQTKIKLDSAGNISLRKFKKE